MNSLDQRTQHCLSVLPQLGDIALKYFRSNSLNIENKANKGDYDPVTVADKEIEKAFRDHILSTFPDDNIIGEEFENTHSHSLFEWVIDPIDGTRAFVIGSPSFTTLISLKYDGQSKFGVILQPFTREIFMADKNGANWISNGKSHSISVSQVRELKDAKIATTFPEVGSKAEASAFLRVASACELTRYGMDGYAYALLAAGHIDLVIESGLKPFDYEGPKAVVEGAGGVFCSWTGGHITSNGQVIAASTKELAQAAIDQLAQVDQ